MCGISFLLDRTGALGPQAASRMRAATAHRGPDGCGSYQFGDGGPGTVYLGHNRLKIVDLSDDANQPFVSADGRYALVYNGEIYNWRELRTELETEGVSFKSQSDTEVLLHLLIREGTAGLPKLRGMFAFVFYDSAEKQTIAVRDEHGIKPLFWANSDEALAIASEISAVRTSGVEADLTEPAIKLLRPLDADYELFFTPHSRQEYLTYRYVKHPPWVYLHEVKPGTAKVWTGLPYDELWTELRYSAERVIPPHTSRAEWLPRVEALLKQSLDRHLRADVPVGLWLSGGVDSTLLLALAREVTDTAPACFGISLAPTEGSFGTEDYRFGRRAAALFGAEFTEISVDDSLLNYTDESLAALGQPIADSSVLLTWWLARQTRAAGVKAVLSGAGADEWFAGYNRHRAFAWYQQHEAWIQRLAPLLRVIGQALPTGFNVPGRKQLQLVSKLLTRVGQTASRDVAAHFTALDEALPNLMRSHIISMDLMAKRPTENELLEFDRKTYLPQDILALTDQTSMRHGVEVRTPYLDQDLTAYVGQIPAKELLRNGPKWMLRELLNRRGGQAFTKRRKEGFGLPLTRWLRLPKYAWLFDPIRRQDHPLFEYLAYNETQEFLKRFLAGRHDLGAEAWALITLFRWYDLQKFSS